MNEIAGREFEIQKMSINISDLEQQIETLKLEFELKEIKMNKAFADLLSAKKLEWDIILKKREDELEQQTKLLKNE